MSVPPSSAFWTTRTTRSKAPSDALFEEGFFDDALLGAFIDDMELVLGQDEVSPAHGRVIRWVVLSTSKCFFSHFDANDLYKIKNFDEALYARWCDHYFERLRGLMTR